MNRDDEGYEDFMHEERAANELFTEPRKSSKPIEPIDPADYLGEAVAQPGDTDCRAVLSKKLPCYWTDKEAAIMAGKGPAAEPKPRPVATEALKSAADTVTRLVEENRHQRRTVTARQYQQATKFQVGSEIDEAGLSAIEFRIYAHLVRRADANGECFPSISHICAQCQCERKSAIAALRELELRNFIYSQKKYHAPTHYFLRPAEDWCSLQVK